jgi:hydrogenase maturation protease
MRAVLVGVGNAYRRDDAVGLAVVESLRDRVPRDVTVVASEDEPSRLLDAWDGAPSAVVVDAVFAGSEPGTVHRFDASEEAIPAGVFRSSTHAFGVGEAIELARALGKLPRRVLVYGVEGSEFATGEGLTDPVEAAVAKVADAVLEELVRLAGERR